MRKEDTENKETRRETRGNNEVRGRDKKRPKIRACRKQNDMLRQNSIRTIRQQKIGTARSACDICVPP